MKVWLDLELRENIDDYIALLYALRQDIEVVGVSLTNPTRKEYRLLITELTKYKSNPYVVINGKFTEAEKDISKSLQNRLEEETYNNTFFYPNFIKSIEKDFFKDVVVFCGGCLNFVNKINKQFKVKESVIQGGYAHLPVVEEADLPYKFKSRKRVPSWNLNKDMKSTMEFLNSNPNAKFISKNICHSALVKIEECGHSVIGKVMKKYFTETNNSKRILSDLLAFMHITKPEMITFKNVDLLCDVSENTNRFRWYSEEDENSNYKISVSYNKKIFKDEIRKIMGMKQ